MDMDETRSLIEQIRESAGLEEARGRPLKLSPSALSVLTQGQTSIPLRTLKLQMEMFGELATRVGKMMEAGKLPTGSKKALEAAAEGIKVAMRAAYSARFILNTIAQMQQGEKMDMARDPELAKNISKLTKAARVLPPE